MNTLAHIAGSLALLWLSVFAYDTIGDATLGLAFLAIFLLWLAKTILAAWGDVRTRETEKDKS